MKSMGAYRHKKKFEHLFASMLFTVVFFFYTYLYTYLPFVISVSALGLIFILWAIIEWWTNRAVVEHLFSFYRDLLTIERNMAPKTFSSYRLSFRISLLIVGCILILVGLLEHFALADVEPDVFPFTAFYPVALIVVNVNVHTRHRRMVAGDEDKISGT